MTEALPGCSVSESFGETTVDVPAGQWVRAVSVAREQLGCRYFDWLTAVDEGGDGFAVVCHVWSVEYHRGLLIRTSVTGEDPHLATLTGVAAGAAWHERETHEMFGIVFDGHPNLVPLLLPDGFEGHPLRKDFVLASRVAKEWPGAREPGESSAAGPSRRRMRPPGVPDPADWGPKATVATSAPDEEPLTGAGTATSPTGSSEPPHEISPAEAGAAEPAEPAEPEESAEDAT
ncbi:MAG: NADH-quinone oxidoreductase subunit C [Mycobacteriales bacterium]